jgi:hypothetical protein
MLAHIERHLALSAEDWEAAAMRGTQPVPMHLTQASAKEAEGIRQPAQSLLL